MPKIDKRENIELLNLERQGNSYNKNMNADLFTTETKSSSLNSKQETVSIARNFSI